MATALMLGYVAYGHDKTPRSSSMGLVHPVPLNGPPCTGTVPSMPSSQYTLPRVCMNPRRANDEPADGLTRAILRGQIRLRCADPVALTGDTRGAYQRDTYLRAPRLRPGARRHDQP